MSILITENTTKQEWLDQYKNYPETFKGGLNEKPFFESRIAPIFYEIPVGSKVLDIGCNDGVFLSMIKEKRQCDVFGVDISEPLVKMCVEKGLNVKLADAEKLPFKDNVFDVVCLMEVLSHVMDPKKLLSEIKRVLKPTGYLLGSTPHKNIESYLYEERRLHRLYYDKLSLYNELTPFFPSTHIKVLKAGQFASSFGDTFISGDDAEMLFKCGKTGTLGWNAALMDRSVLRAWFGGTTNPGVFYYRMGGYADKMQKLGAETYYDSYNPSDINTFNRWQLGVSPNPEMPQRPLKPLIVDDLDRILKAADMSVFQITPLPGVLAFLQCAKDAHTGKPMITEMDDWIFDLPSENAAADFYTPNSDPEKIAYKQIKLSDYVICSTDYLKKMVNGLFPDKKVYVIPNSIDFNVWDNLVPTYTNTIPKKNEGIVRIGYTGCDNHTGDLQIAKKAVMAILEEFPNVEMVFPSPKLAWLDMNHPRILISDRWVSIDKFPAYIKGWDLDIGIAPLKDNYMNRAKSNLRWLEYSALKIPGVYSNVVPFKESVKNGSTGLVVKNSPKEWYEALKSLIISKEKRETIGANAYADVKSNFNMDEISKKYLSILKEIKHESNNFARRDRKAA